ncbi:MAG: DUF6258 family protein [Planctomycetota bacterium]
MTPINLVKTIYLGDRACQSITLDGQHRKVVIRVDLISRVRGESWDFYSHEDIPHGQLVFCDVQSVRFDPSGPMPNDLMNDLVVSSVQESAGSKQNYLFSLSIDSVNEKGDRKEVRVEILAADLYLVDPRSPQQEIRE